LSGLANDCSIAAAIDKLATKRIVSNENRFFIGLSFGYFSRTAPQVAPCRTAPPFASKSLLQQPRADLTKYFHSNISPDCGLARTRSIEKKLAPWVRAELTAPGHWRLGDTFRDVRRDLHDLRSGGCQHGCPASQSLFENVVQTSCLPVRAASCRPEHGAGMPPEPSGWKPDPHSQTGSQEVHLQARLPFGVIRSNPSSDPCQEQGKRLECSRAIWKRRG
jgi:hypothetical protein